MNALITTMIFLPLLGLIGQIVFPKSFYRILAIASSLLSSFLGIALVLTLDLNLSQHVTDLHSDHRIDWLGFYDIHYLVSIDGMNSLMVLLISILFPIILASEWEQKKGQAGLNALVLLMQTSLMGAVCSKDLFLQFFFWTISLLPIYFMISIWGGEKREGSSFRALTMGFLGHALSFAALVLVYYAVTPHTFSLVEISGGKIADQTILFFGKEILVAPLAFILFALGLVCRVPIWPLHGWFTQALQEAPLSAVAIFCGAVIPVGLSLFIQNVFHLFPTIILSYSVIFIVFGLISLFFSMICLCSQKNLRGFMSYLSLFQVGVALLSAGSLDSAAFVGGVFHQLAFGVSLAALALFIKLFEIRTGTVVFLNDEKSKTFGGLALQTPWLAIFAALSMASLLGFPTTLGFVGHSLLFLGAYSLGPGALIVGVFIFSLLGYAVFLVYRNIFLGKEQSSDRSGFADLTVFEKIYLLPLFFLMIAGGVYPKPFIDLIRPAALTLLSTVK